MVVILIPAMVSEMIVPPPTAPSSSTFLSLSLSLSLSLLFVSVENDFFFLPCRGLLKRSFLCFNGLKRQRIHSLLKTTNIKVMSLMF